MRVIYNAFEYGQCVWSVWCFFLLPLFFFPLPLANAQYVDAFCVTLVFALLAGGALMYFCRTRSSLQRCCQTPHQFVLWCVFELVVVTVSLLSCAECEEELERHGRIYAVLFAMAFVCTWLTPYSLTKELAGTSASSRAGRSLLTTWFVSVLLIALSSLRIEPCVYAADKRVRVLPLYMRFKRRPNVLQRLSNRWGVHPCGLAALLGLASFGYALADYRSYQQKHKYTAPENFSNAIAQRCMLALGTQASALIPLGA